MSTRIKYLVLARRKNDAIYWARRNSIDRKAWKYAGLPFALDGINNVEVIRLPGCENNPRFDELDEKIRWAKHNGVTERALCKYPGCDAPVCDQSLLLGWLPSPSRYCSAH